MGQLMGAETVGTMKADVLIRIHGSDEQPHEVATVDLPIRSELVAEGQVKVWVDTGAFADLGRALALELAGVLQRVDDA